MFQLSAMYTQWNCLYKLLACMIWLLSTFRTVELFKSPGFLHVMTVQVHHKLINSIQWHPYVTMETPGGSPYKYWLATGSTEQMVSVVDVSKIFGKTKEMKIKKKN